MDLGLSGEMHMHIRVESSDNLSNATDSAYREPKGAQGYVNANLESAGVNGW